MRRASGNKLVGCIAAAFTAIFFLALGTVALISQTSVTRPPPSNARLLVYLEAKVVIPVYESKGTAMVAAALADASEEPVPITWAEFQEGRETEYRGVALPTHRLFEGFAFEQDCGTLLTVWKNGITDRWTPSGEWLF